MAKDESKFDTMRLIAGAESSNQYSLEDIMQEFSEETDAQKAVESTEGAITHQQIESPAETEIAVPVEPALSQHETITEKEPAKEIAAEETFSVQSESEIADVIAQAVAASLGTEEENAGLPTEVASGKIENRMGQGEAGVGHQHPAPKLAEDTAVQQNLSPDRIARTPVRNAQAEHVEDTRETLSAVQDHVEEGIRNITAAVSSTAEAEKTEEKSLSGQEKVEKKLPNVKMAETSGKQRTSIKNPGTQQGKIPKSHVHTSFAEILGSTIGELRTRQRAILPPNKASLKAAEKRNALQVRISGVLAPLRYIIVVLMFLMLAGRKFSWMLLGFLGGSTGVSIALILTLMAMLMAWQSVVRGVRDAIYLRFSYETLLLLTTVLSLIDTAVQKSETTLLPLLAMAWCLSGTAALMTTRTNLRSLHTVITGRNRKAVRISENKWEHTACIGKAPASTAGFVRRQEEADTWHSGWSAYSILLVFAALIVSAYLTAKTKENYLTTLVTLLTVATPVSLVLCCARPYELLTRAMNGRGAISGWYGVKAMSGKKAVLIYDDDLFPNGTIGHKGVKVYGKQTPRLLVSYAASLVLRADNGLGEVFTRLLRETDGKIYDVSYFQIMEAGLAGRINGVLVAVGTHNFMQLLGAMPPANAPKNGIYISINGEVAGVFAIKYRVRGAAADGFARLVGEQGLTTLVVTKNFCVNPSFVENWFQAPVSRITCPKLETRRMLSEPSLLARGITCGYVLKEGVAIYGRLVAGSRRVYRTGLYFTVLSILLSVVLLIHTAMAIASGGNIMGGAQLLFYQMLLFLIVEFSARIAVK